MVTNDIEQGRAVYEQSCKVCHGKTGEGDGPAGYYNGAYSGPRPRNFTIGNFTFRSTPTGEFPLDDDLYRVVRRGIPGYMPSFAGLGDAAIRNVVAYLKTLIPDFPAQGPVAMTLPRLNIPPTSTSLKKGRAIYLSFGCVSCHGVIGDGEGKVAIAGGLRDSSGLPLRAADLTNGAGLKYGRTAEDILRTLFTGLDGTPMPSYASQFTLQPEDAYHLANYVHSLSLVR